MIHLGVRVGQGWVLEPYIKKKKMQPGSVQEQSGDPSPCGKPVVPAWQTPPGGSLSAVSGCLGLSFLPSHLF